MWIDYKTNGGGKGNVEEFGRSKQKTRGGNNRINRNYAEFIWREDNGKQEGEQNRLQKHKEWKHREESGKGEGGEEEEWLVCWFKEGVSPDYQGIQGYLGKNYGY